MLQRFLTLWLILSSGLAFLWPDLTRNILLIPESWDPFGQGEASLKPAIVVTMFSVGCLLPFDELRQVLRRWPVIFYGTCAQFVIMPVLAWLVVVLMQVPGELRTGILLVGCVPGAMASNVLTLAARGNVSYSVGLTTSATLLSPIIVPLVLRATAGETISVEALIGVSRSLLWYVVLPVVVGFFLSRRFTSVRKLADRHAEAIANLAILWIIAVVVGLQRERLGSPAAHEMLMEVSAALLIMNLAGYAGGYFAGSLIRLPTGMRRALSIEVGMQNAGVGTVLATTMLGERSPALIPTAMYTFGCMLTGTCLAQAFSCWKSKPSCQSDGPIDPRGETI